jgi:hypothetical protein
MKDSIRIDKFLKQYFNNVSDMDFFLEIQPQIIFSDDQYSIESIEDTRKGKRYIDLLFRFFIDNFKIKRNRVSKSDIYPNIRFHYVDLRDLFMLYDIFDVMRSVTKYLKDLSYKKVKIGNDNLILMINGIKIIFSRLQFIYNEFYIHDLYVFPEDLGYLLSEDEKVTKKVSNIINKLRKVYNYIDVKVKVNHIIDHELKEDFEELFDKIKYILKLLNDGIIFIKKKYSIDDKYLVESLLSLLNDIVSNYLRIISKITDLYFIRRFLDKDYIKKGITYTGISHSIMYLYILVKYFNFNIVNYVYLNNDMEDIIKSINYIDNFKVLLRENELKDNLFYQQFVNKQLIQCVDVTKFNFII